MKNFMKTSRRALSIAALTTAVSLTAGCSLFSVYTIDIPQGTPITQTQAQTIRAGMTQGQVAYVLGSPALRDTLAPNRWDYIYDYQAGTIGKREGKMDIKDASQHFIVYFDDNGQVVSTQGIETLPQ